MTRAIAAPAAALAALLALALVPMAQAPDEPAPHHAIRMENHR